MKEQNYSNHAQIVPLFHYVLFGLLVLTLIGAGVNLYKSVGDHQRLYSASLLFVLTICVIMLCLFARVFALRAQDRAIRAEENLRHYVLTGRLLDARLGIGQIIALRFAADDELAGLAERAVSQSMSAEEIKRAVVRWRADFHRV